MWGRPTVEAFLGDPGIQCTVLLDTGASLNILACPINSGQPTNKHKIIEGFTGGKEIIPIWENIPYRIGTVKGSLTGGLRKGQGTSLLGNPFFVKEKFTIDLANGFLWKWEKGPDLISAIHRCAALKAPMPLCTIASDPWVSFLPDVWSPDKAACGRVPANVLIEGPDPPPQKQYKYPKEAEEGIGKTIEGLLKWDVITPMPSICNAPLWPVLKQDQVTWRMTVDFRALNACTPQVTPVVAKYNEILMAVAAGSKWFSVLDLSNAFHSITLHPACWYKFGFTYKNKQYVFKRTPMGFHSSPTICHTFVTQMWDQLEPKHKDHVTSYVDDILIHSDSKELTANITKEVLQIIHKTGFMVSRDKAQLVKEEVRYLGVDLGQGGRSPTKQRVEVVAKMPAPTDVHTLRAALGTFGFSREFIEDYAGKSKPLLKLLRKGAKWEWGPEQQEAFLKLKESILKAPALANPNMSLPFYIQLAASEVAIGATLIQHQSFKPQIVAYASRVLTGVERKFSTCEKVCLALVWSLKHWEYMIGGSRVIVQTSHSPLKYIISGKIQDGQVSNPRIAQWTLALVSRGVEFKSEPKETPSPYGLIIEGDSHECPIPEDKPLQWPVEWGEPLDEAKKKGFSIWFTDGSSFYIDGKQVTGYGAIRVNDNFSLSGNALPHSSQAAEIEALMAVLQYENPDSPLAIYTDSDFSAKAAVQWLPHWLNNNMKSAENQAVVHSSKWKKIAELLKARTAKTWVVHVKGHQGTSTEAGKWNEQADAIAKAAAAKSKLTNQPVAPVRTRQQNKPVPSNPPLLDLETLQQGDKEIQELENKGSDKTGKYKIERHNRLVWAIDTNGNKHWIVPAEVRADLIQFVHEQGHTGIDKTLARVRDTGWWPSIREDVLRWCKNCLACASVNADHSGPKAPILHQRVEGPWARLQIDFIGPLPLTKNQNRHCLVIFDPFSKWLEAFPCKRNTAATTAKILFNSCFSRWGLPKEISSDRGGSFIGEVMQELCKALGIKQRFHIARHPQSSGYVERSNRVIKEALRKQVNSAGTDWDERLPLILWALRGSKAIHGFTPFTVMTGRKMRMPESWWLGTEIPNQWEAKIVSDEWVKNLIESLETVHKHVAIQLGIARDKMDKRLGWVRNPVQWEEGQQVLYRKFSEAGHSLTHKWEGPVPISKKVSPAVYQVKLVRAGKPHYKFFHVSQLKQWGGTPIETTPVNVAPQASITVKTRAPLRSPILQEGCWPELPIINLAETVVFDPGGNTL